jgi:hypothetical protein
MTTWNKKDYNKWVKSGCPKNDKIIILNCCDNNLISLVKIKNFTKEIKFFVFYYSIFMIFTHII